MSTIVSRDFIHWFHLNYDTETRGFFWKKSNEWQKGSLRAKKTQTLDSYCVNFIQCDVWTESGGRPKPGVCPAWSTSNTKKGPS